jgi:hypothetical protein
VLREAIEKGIGAFLTGFHKREDRPLKGKKILVQSTRAPNPTRCNPYYDKIPDYGGQSFIENHYLKQVPLQRH